MSKAEPVQHSTQIAEGARGVNSVALDSKV